VTLAAIAGLAWLGACLLMLSDGRRGLGVGLLVAGAALAGVRFVEGEALQGAAVLAGTLAAVFLGWRRSRRRGWGTLPAQSTPRVVACVVLGGFALWLARAALTAPGAWPDRAAVAAVTGVAAARLLTADEPLAALAAASAIALAGGIFAAVAEPAMGLAAAFIGAGIATGLNVVPVEQAAAGRG
jgi:hypothetical protein